MQLIWEEFLKIIKEEAGSQVVETWFKAVSLNKWDSVNKTIILQMPNQFVSRWIQEHYANLIKKHMSRLLSQDQLEILFICNNISLIKPERDIIPATSKNVVFKENEIENPNKLDPNKLNIEETAFQSSSTELVTRKNNLPNLTENKNRKKILNIINPAYNFNSFIVGPNNSLAHAASWAICQNLGKVYNPLFIYGGTGLGKTHLLHAIGNEVKRNNPSSTVFYQTSDYFTNEFINSIRTDKIHQFRDKYQKADLLLLDDVQFLSNKEQTQEIFFHIFNAFYEQKKQIILSSDTFPKEIAGLQKRLKSRLEWGLVVDIQIPDLETKIAILKKKADLHSINLTDDVADFIASRIISNIRELEGALIRVGAFATLTNQKLTLEMAKKVLLHLEEKKREGISLEVILKIVAKNYSIPIIDLKSKKRQKEVSTVRQVAFYLMKKLTFFSLQTIGEFIGKRDHSTVLHAISKIEDMLKTSTTFSQKLKAIEQEILSS